MFKKLLTISIISSLAFTSLIGCEKKDENTTKIGISQLVEHPALDLAREGFIKELEEQGFKEGENLEIDVENAQGDIPTSQTIANKFKNDKKDLIFAIATPSAQGALNATKEIPVVFTAVTDPVSAKLVNSIEKPGKNVTGTSDFIDIQKSLDLIKIMVPNVKKIGVVFNTSEINSKMQVDALKKATKKDNIEVKELGVSSTNEINQAVGVLCKDVDVIYTPTDNLVVSSIPVIVEISKKAKIPVIGAEEAHVQKGAVASNSISFEELGRQSAKMAVKILNGEEPGEIAVEFPKSSRIVVNKKMLDELGLKVPEGEKVEFIN